MKRAQDVRKLVAIMSYHMEVQSCGKDLVRLRVIVAITSQYLQEGPNEGYKTLLEGQAGLHPPVFFAV